MIGNNKTFTHTEEGKVLLVLNCWSARSHLKLFYRSLLCAAATTNLSRREIMRTANLLLLLFEIFLCIHLHNQVPIAACLLLLSYILLSFFFAFVHNFCLLCFYFFVKRRKYKRKKPFRQSWRMYVRDPHQDEISLTKAQEMFLRQTSVYGF